MKFINTFLILFSICMLVIFAACTPAESPDGESDDQDTQTGQQDNSADTEDGDDVAFEYTDEDGTTTISADEDTWTMESEDSSISIARNQDLPEGWPENVPVMKGFDIIGTTEVIDEDEITISIIASGDIDLDEIDKFYSNLEGWSENAPIKMPQPDGILIMYETDGEELNITAHEEDVETILTLVYTTGT